MSLLASKTVKEVAVEMPQSTRIFENLKIDYCCGGNSPLLEACANAGIEIEQLERMLSEADSAPSSEGGPDFQTMTLTELVGHIVNKHHVYTKAEITRLGALLTKVAAVHGENHSELRDVEKLFQQLSADLAPHMMKEEMVLFPYIVELEQAQSEKGRAPFAPFGTVKNPVRMMMMEHDTAGDILRELRNVTGDYTVPTDVCISYQTLYNAMKEFERDLHQHIHLENNLLFPRAVEMEEALACQ
jgi:regulator of cell morphogenesis and NO signaling